MLKCAWIEGTLPLLLKAAKDISIYSLITCLQHYQWYRYSQLRQGKAKGKQGKISKANQAQSGRRVQAVHALVVHPLFDIGDNLRE